MNAWSHKTNLKGGGHIESLVVGTFHCVSHFFMLRFASSTIVIFGIMLDHLLGLTSDRGHFFNGAAGLNQT